MSSEPQEEHGGEPHGTDQRGERDAGDRSPASPVIGPEPGHPPAIAQLSSRIVYSNNWMTVREDEVRFPGGHEGIFGVVEKSDFALVIPWDGVRLHLVRQYRYPVGGAHWEFPPGSAEDGTHTPEELARRELAEETGLSAGEMTGLGFLYQANGYASQGFHVFLVTRLTPGERRLEATEAGMQAGAFTVDEFERMLLDGEVKDGPTVAAYGLLRVRGGLP